MVFSTNYVPLLFTSVSKLTFLQPTWLLLDVISHKRRLEQFDELLVQDAYLVPSEAAVLVED